MNTHVENQLRTSLKALDSTVQSGNRLIIMEDLKFRLEMLKGSLNPPANIIHNIEVMLAELESNLGLSSDSVLEIKRFYAVLFSAERNRDPLFNLS
ncbi:hypothetical protein [Paenibacillus prosopidis]|uniref:Uncharacterized protein n=1 Tax=Paenibacillus prosopidis TaxID=630520 RepID=A0A368VLK6_9BACL|nr:hypothetical protein [Paenibacillus prosopidis]RCW41576.1 hypothetical protein DFP97_12212 [Paenibacillus prosopidis]